MLDFSRFIKKPIIKEVDELDNCHFRTLYRRDTFYDNYTDPDFLCSLQLNTNLNYYSLTEAIVATTRLSLNICTCVLYFIFYYHLGHDNITPTSVFRISFSCAIVGYFILNMWRFWNDKWNLETLMKVSLIWDLKVSFLCGIFCYLLTPMLRTLTNTMDIDTVHAWCTILFGVHLFCNNYGMMAYCVCRALSTNSAIFAMFCLGSRLQSDNHCLSLLSFGVLCFICFPQFAKMLWNWTPGSVLYFLLLSGASYTVSPGFMLFYVVCMFMTIVVAPSLYVVYIQYKQNIMGPWDEAIPDLNIDMDAINRGFEERKYKPPVRSRHMVDETVEEWEAMGIGQPL
ncbi:unnamed protein product [Orchesella dallaii]|uniref:Phosphatidylinositol N-acetylglucosaminyltransferase subunit C n=1 Tax=Orchesella dallaii TaxID=48710 RepID=A0ABP1PU72_9HEXA